VFSAGSMAFTGALSHNGFANPLVTVVRNVLARFRDPAPIPPPPTVQPLPYISQASSVGPLPGEEEPAPAAGEPV
jgi:hypothetical protein